MHVELEYEGMGIDCFVHRVQIGISSRRYSSRRSERSTEERQTPTSPLRMNNATDEVIAKLAAPGEHGLTFPVPDPAPTTIPENVQRLTAPGEHGATTLLQASAAKGIPDDVQRLARQIKNLPLNRIGKSSGQPHCCARTDLTASSSIQADMSSQVAIR